MASDGKEMEAGWRARRSYSKEDVVQLDYMWSLRPLHNSSQRSVERTCHMDSAQGPREDAGYLLVGPQPVVPYLVAQSMVSGKDKSMAEVEVGMILQMILSAVL